MKCNDTDSEIGILIRVVLNSLARLKALLYVLSDVPKQGMVTP